jgi:hypothetical protein
MTGRVRVCRWCCYRPYPEKSKAISWKPAHSVYIRCRSNIILDCIRNIPRHLSLHCVIFHLLPLNLGHRYRVEEEDRCLLGTRPPPLSRWMRHPHTCKFPRRELGGEYGSTHRPMASIAGIRPPSPPCYIHASVTKGG